MTDPRFIPAVTRENMMTWTLHEGTGYRTHLPLLHHATAMDERLAAADRRIAELEAERGRLKAMVTQLLDRSLATDERIAELEADWNTMEERMMRALAQLAEARSLIDELAEQLEDVEAYRPDICGSGDCDACEGTCRAQNDFNKGNQPERVSATRKPERYRQ